MSCGPRGSKSILAKAASVEPFGEMRDQKLHAVRAGDTFRSQNGKKKHLSLAVLLDIHIIKKVHAIVARSRFRSQIGKNTTCSEHCWKLVGLRCVDGRVVL